MSSLCWISCKRGRQLCSDSHARFTCTRYNTHALAHYTLTVYLQLCTFYFWPYRIRTHFLSPCFSFLLSFSFWFLWPRGTHLVPRHWWLPTWGLHGPCVLVDSARPDGARGRNHTPFSTTTWPRATRSATTSTSLGHEQLARPCHLFSRPRACNSLSHRYEIARPQQQARPRAQSLPIYLFGPRATRSVSDSAFSCKLTPTPQRYRKFGRELPATSNSTSARSSLVISGSASITSSPHTWLTCLGQACRPCCLRVTAGTDHLNTLSLEFAKFVTLWEFSDNSSWFLTLQSQVLYGRFLNFRLFVSISHVLHIHLTFIFVLLTGFLSFFEEGGTVVTPMHVSHVRTTTPTHLHTTH